MTEARNTDISLLNNPPVRPGVGESEIPFTFRVGFDQIKQSNSLVVTGSPEPQERTGPGRPAGRPGRSTIAETLFPGQYRGGRGGYGGGSRPAKWSNGRGRAAHDRPHESRHHRPPRLGHRRLPLPVRDRARTSGQ
ncbi:hypothetical protein THAOC_28564 [Thalassiosira oceanica]|uniref:Uncharacterized protein n=1 Tax=Thalassiosira oceanica TaxID=159749 RepID=K0RG59_THAOC|nr:hypothetical protein THAOC_28564 [Thalassiosira oceanica]|eukprot:EJK52195.1 hypothetical protein THAOC_28564 [Thalassiosira oceanica]